MNVNNNNSRPYVICLMMTSVDGKILADKWGTGPEITKLVDKFEEVHETIGVQAWIVGRTTMEKDFTNFAPPIHKQTQKVISREDFVANEQTNSFAIAVDPHAKLGWKVNHVGNDHVITVLTENVEDSYLAHLQDINVSYIFAGNDGIDVNLLLFKLRKLFGIDRLMLEGGGHLNGSFLEANVIDELQHLLLPIVDGTSKNPTLFETGKSILANGATLLKLESFRRYSDDVLWITYKFQK